MFDVGISNFHARLEFKEELYMYMYIKQFYPILVKIINAPVMWS